MSAHLVVGRYNTADEILTFREERLPMSTVPLPPRRGYYLRIFTLSMLILVAALLAFLFGVRMEVSVPAVGLLQARDQQTLRSPAAGLVELGWYEGKVDDAAGKPLAFRVDIRGDGLTDPGHGTALPIKNYQLPDGRIVKDAKRELHVLAAGDHLWPGQVLGWVRAENAKPPTGMEAGDGWQTVQVPARHALWQALKVHVEPHAAVAAGASLVTIAPLDPANHEPVEVIARLEIAEEAGEEVVVGQTVRLYSNVYNPRLHGPAEGKVLTIDPLVETHADGKRYFHATASVTQSPFPLRLGTGVTAKVVVSRKTVYRIILEH